MLTPKNTPGELPEHERFDETAKQFYSLLTSPFERNFESYGYRARFDLRVARDRVIYHDKNQNEFSRLTGLTMDQTRDWHIELGYIAEQRTLGVTSIDIPVQDTSPNQSLILKRLHDFGYFPTITVSGQDEPSPHQPNLDSFESALDAELFPSPIEGGHEQFMFSFEEVSQMLFDAGYDLTERNTDPTYLRLHTANSIANAPEWYMEETVVVPLTPQKQMTITRSTNLLSKTTNKRTIGSHYQIDTKVISIIENVDSTSDTKEQLVIEFEGEDYTVKKPLIYERRLQLDTSAAGVQEFGNDHYIVTTTKPLTVTSKLIDQLLVSIISDMIGD